MCMKPVENIYSFTHLEIWGLKLRKVKQLSQSYIASRWTRCFSNLDLCHYRALGLFSWVLSPLLQFWSSLPGKGAVSYHRCSGEKVAYLSCPRQLQAFCSFISPHHCHSINHCSLALPKKKKGHFTAQILFSEWTQGYSSNQGSFYTKKDKSDAESGWRDCNEVSGEDKENWIPSLRKIKTLIFLSLISSSHGFYKFVDSYVPFCFTYLLPRGI